MKYLALGAVLLAALFIFSTFSGIQTATRLDAVLETLQQASSAAQAGDDAAAAELLQTAADAWNAALPRLELLQRQPELDAVSQSFARLQAAAPDEIPALCAELTEQLRQLRQTDHLSLNNLL